jgi:DNA-directed RNA polymerase specialized sigma24 family protein
MRPVAREFVEADGRCRMPSPEEGSVTHWIAALKQGDADAAQRLWGRYFDQLVRLARTRFGTAPRGAADEEDAALSAFHSLCTGAARGQFERLDGRDDLWRLLVTITVRKVLGQVRHQRTRKRGGGLVLGEAELAGSGPDVVGGGLDLLAGSEPTPEFAAMLEEQYRHLLEVLPESSLRDVARLRLEGYTGEEIAVRLGCNRRTITRKLELIRQTWSEAVHP